MLLLNIESDFNVWFWCRHPWKVCWIPFVICKGTVIATKIAKLLSLVFLILRTVSKSMSWGHRALIVSCSAFHEPLSPEISHYSVTLPEQLKYQILQCSSPYTSSPEYLLSQVLVQRKEHPQEKYVEFEFSNISLSRGLDDFLQECYWKWKENFV